MKAGLGQLVDIQTRWTLADLEHANLVLDLQDLADARARAEQNK